MLRAPHQPGSVRGDGAAAWDKLTDKLGRDNQVKYYRIAMGLT